MFSSLVNRVNFPILSKYKLNLVGVLLLVVSLLAIYQVLALGSKTQNLSSSLEEKEQLVASLSARAKSLQASYDRLKSEDSVTKLKTITEVIDKYQVVKDKSAAYKTQGVDTASVDSQFTSVVDNILAGKYVEADTLLTTLDGSLETALKDKLVADASAAPKASSGSSSTTCSAVPSSGYCRLTINGFTVDMVVGSVGSVWTDTGDSNDCTNNCATKSLQAYVQGNGGYAGMNGTYFCPPDYSSCAGKINSYDFPVYNSNASKWLNYGTILWENRAMMAFTSSGVTFYPQASSYSGQAVRAGIVNYPGLVYNGANIVSQYSLTSAQNTKGYRGGIGVKGSSVYLVIARSATVGDLAAIMTSIGMTHALNLDGGGSSALYHHGYKIGPGRSLPNAMVLK